MSVLQEKLSAIRITCIENYEFHSLSIDNIIYDFALLKPRKKVF